MWESEREVRLVAVTMESSSGRYPRTIELDEAFVDDDRTEPLDPVGRIRF